jgi:LmbE family N-acetylglucosaminyl deacetylase
MPPDVVVLSPHLDDAVLSIGGLIGREVAAGKRVEVWTFYTAGPPLADIPAKRRVFGDYTARRDEDVRALEVLGAAHRWLDLRERIWREPTLAKTLHVFHTPPREDDFAQLAVVRARVRDALATGATVYAPLAVGHHVDHVEVALASLRELLARGAHAQMRFYEDPYALGAGCRNAHFVTRRRPWPRFGSPSWASPRVAALLRVVALSARGPGLEAYLPEAAALAWTSTPAPVSDADEERKLAACLEYGSQMKAFGGADRVRRFMRRGHRVLGGEGVWATAPG